MTASTAFGINALIWLLYAAFLVVLHLINRAELRKDEKSTKVHLQDKLEESDKKSEQER